MSGVCDGATFNESASPPALVATPWPGSFLLLGAAFGVTWLKSVVITACQLLNHPLSCTESRTVVPKQNSPRPLVFRNSLFPSNLPCLDRCMSISTLNSSMPGLLFSAGLRNLLHSVFVRSRICSFLVDPRIARFGQAASASCWIHRVDRVDSGLSVLSGGLFQQACCFSVLNQ